MSLSGTGLIRTVVGRFVFLFFFSFSVGKCFGLTKHETSFAGKL